MISSIKKLVVMGVTMNIFIFANSATSLVEQALDRDLTGAKLMEKLLMVGTARTKAYLGISKFVFQDHVHPGSSVNGQR